MKKKKILFLGIVILFFTFVDFNYSYKGNNFKLNLLGMNVKAEEAPIINLDINDGQTYTSNDVNVKGWALNNSGVKAVDLYVDGKFIKSLNCNFSTPDVYKQFPNYNNSANCGYEYKLSLSNGAHTIKVYNIGNDGKVISKEAKITVNSQQKDVNLDPKMELYINDGQTYTSNNVDVKGWALNNSGVKAVDLYVDGKFIKSLNCNFSTPDVYKQFSNYNNSASCGYEYKLSLNNGTHTIRAYDIGNDSKIIYKEVKIKVTDSSSNNTKINPSLATKMNLEIKDGQAYSSGSTIDVRGWAISGYGIKAADLYVDGKFIKSLDCNLSRPDVKNAFSDYPGAANSGYDYKLLLSEGTHKITVYAISNDGTHISNEVVVNVNVPINQSLKTKMNLEIKNGQAYSSGSTIDVRGWAISGYGIKAADLYVDGKFIKSLDCNLSRPDVKNAFSDYQGAANSGYDYKLLLSEGTHKITVYAISNDGTHISNEVVVFVNVSVNPSLKFRMNLEINNGQAFADGNIDVRGWALSGYGIKAADLYVDGEFKKSLDCNLSRPDVKNAFPDYPGSENSGYDYKLSLPYGTHVLKVYAISNNGTNIYQDVVIFVGMQDVGRTQSSIQLKLLNYLISNKENRDSVKSAAVALHDGDASNTCVYFSSEALRRIGINVPKSVANTHQYTNVLSSYGWRKSDNYKSLVPGDICFTTDGYDGYPTHTYVFAGWVDDTYTTAYIIDNQNELYGDELHERIIPYATSSFDKFQYFFYTLN